MPWWDSVTARTIERPSPLDPPRSLEPRKKRSKTLSRSSSGMPGPVVLDGEHDVAVDALHLRLDRRARVRVPERVLHQVEDQPVQLVARAVDDHARRGGDRDLVVAGHGLELGGRVGHDRGDVDRLVRRPRARRPRARAAAGRRPGGASGARSAARRRRPRAARRPGTPPAARGWRAPRSAACAARARRRRRTRAGGRASPRSRARASPSAASIDSSVRASSATSSSESGRGIRTAGSRERSTSRAAVGHLGDRLHRAARGGEAGQQREQARRRARRRPRNTFTRLAVACTVESRCAYWMTSGSA